MQRRIDGRGAAAWVAAASAAMLLACQAPATSADPPTANAAVAADVRPMTEATVAEPQLGAFATNEEALAAARQAGLARGAAASATIDGETVGIVRDGETYVIVKSTAKTGSGRPQRPPTKAEIVEP